MNQECVAKHASWVASRIAASANGLPIHASDVDLLVGNTESFELTHSEWFADPNNPVDGGAASLFQFRLIDRYNYFWSQGARIINESWGYEGRDSNVSFKERLNDLYSRESGFTFVQAAGNRQGADVMCHALNSVCVGSTSAEATYMDSPLQYLDDVIPSSSSWRNPNNTLSIPSYQKDAERPDVVSEGDQATVMDVDGPPDSWNRQNGTSYAAPAITGLLALFQQCRDETFRSATARSVLRTSAWVRQELELDPHAPLYPIPGTHNDSRAGAGIVDAHNLMRFCDGSDPDIGFEEDEVDLEGPQWVSVPEWMISDSPPDPSIPQNKWEDVESRLQKLVRAPGNSPYMMDLRSFGPMTEGTRVRITFSYYTCPDDWWDDLEHDLRPAVDLDIALCPSAQPYCLVYSESLDDTNEGFDIIIDDDYQDVRLVLLRDVNDTKYCRDSSIEPYSFAWKIWRPLL